MNGNRRGLGRDMYDVFTVHCDDTRQCESLSVSISCMIVYVIDLKVSVLLPLARMNLSVCIISHCCGKFYLIIDNLPEAIIEKTKNTPLFRAR